MRGYSGRSNAAKRLVFMAFKDNTYVTMVTGEVSDEKE